MKHFDITDPKMPSIKEFRDMTEEEYEGSLANYWGKFYSKNLLERLVIRLRWKWQYIRFEVPENVRRYLERLY